MCSLGIALCNNNVQSVSGGVSEPDRCFFLIAFALLLWFHYFFWLFLFTPVLILFHPILLGSHYFFCIFLSKFILVLFQPLLPGFISFSASLCLHLSCLCFILFFLDLIFYCLFLSTLVLLLLHPFLPWYFPCFCSFFACTSSHNYFYFFIFFIFFILSCESFGIYTFSTFWRVDMTPKLTAHLWTHRALVSFWFCCASVHLSPLLVLFWIL